MRKKSIEKNSREYMGENPRNDDELREQWCRRLHQISIDEGQSISVGSFRYMAKRMYGRLEKIFIQDKVEPFFKKRPIRKYEKIGSYLQTISALLEHAEIDVGIKTLETIYLRHRRSTKKTAPTPLQDRKASQIAWRNRISASLYPELAEEYKKILQNI